MEETMEKMDGGEITQDDRLWAALSWIPLSPVWPILAILALLMEDTKNRPFVRYHAVHSIVTGLALILITVVTFGCGGILLLVPFYWAYMAYQGEYVEVPGVTHWIRQQGWART